MPKLTTGSKAPSFTLTDKDGKKVSLSSLKSKFTIIYFYPKDDTPGCTIEAQEFNDSLAMYKKAGAEIIGISGGTNKTKEKFCTKCKLKLTLLSDTDFAVAKAYGSYGKKKFMGKEYDGIFRKTFVLDANKKITHVFEEVSPKGHAKEVLMSLKSAPKAKATAVTMTKKLVVKKLVKKVTAKPVLKKKAPTKAPSAKRASR